jgi:hypothetical protein
MTLCCRRWAHLASLSAALALCAGGGAAQSVDSGPLFGVGYVANAPQMLAGGAVWGVIPGLRGFGLYLDFKTSLGSASNNANFEEGLTAAEAQEAYGDEFFDQEDDWRAVNVALVRPLTPELIVYVGGGVSWNTHYQEFWDPTFERGDIGWYWVEDPAESGSYANIMAGGFLRIAPRIRIQFGGETKPAGFTVGVSLNQPAR